MHIFSVPPIRGFAVYLGFWYAEGIMACKALMDFDLVFVAKPFAGAIVKCMKACKALVQFDLGSFRCYTLCWCTCEIH